MQKYAGVAMDTAGNVLANPTVTVTLAGTTTLAPIFSDNAFTPLANPFTGDADGTVRFYGHGRFDLTFTKPGFTLPAAQTSDLFLYDPMSSLTFTLAASANDYAPLNGSYVSTWRLTAPAPVTLTGIVAGFAGQSLTITNVGPSAITLANASGASAAANQILTGGSDFAVSTGQSAVLRYDAVSTAWRIVGMTAATTTSVSTGTTGAYRSINLRGANASTTSYALSADLVIARNPSDGSTTVLTTPSVTLDITASGPVANGRDQSGSFTAGSWVYAYWIGKADGTKAALASATAPPTGPTLPAGYTHWAYIRALRVNASSQLVASVLRDRWVDYNAKVAVLTTGTATTETAIDCSAAVPPTAQSFRCHLRIESTNNDNTHPFKLRHATGLDYYTIDLNGAGFGGYKLIDALTVPNVSQSLFYLFTSGHTGDGLTLSILGYEDA